MIAIPLRLERLQFTTFFEYETDFYYISIVSGLKNMEDSRDRRFQVKR